MQKLGEESERGGVIGEKPFTISDRLLDFAASVIKLTYEFPKDIPGKHIGNELQLILAKSVVTTKGVQA